MNIKKRNKHNSITLDLCVYAKKEKECKIL